MLEQTGQHRIQASREIVWQALNDPDVLGECIAGCEDVTRVDDERFDVKVKAKIGPVSATFEAALELSDLDPPSSYVINGSVKGGAAGFAKGSARVTLHEDGDATVLDYSVSASVGGKLAQVGSRLVDGAARKMANDFFAAFSTRVGTAGMAAAPIDDATDSHTLSGAADQPRKEAGQWPIWAIAFGVLVLALVLSF